MPPQLASTLVEAVSWVPPVPCSRAAGSPLWLLPALHLLGELPLLHYCLADCCGWGALGFLQPSQKSQFSDQPKLLPPELPSGLSLSPLEPHATTPPPTCSSVCSTTGLPLESLLAAGWPAADSHHLSSCRTAVR